MLAAKARLLHESLRRYIRRQAFDHLDKLIAKTRDEELADVMGSMATDDQLAIFRRIKGDERKANIVVLMPPPFAQTVLNPMKPEQAASILKEMAQDDMADILADLDPEVAAAALEILEKSDEVESLMQYGDETAGGIMLPEFVALEDDATVEEALIALRENRDVEMVYYIYVVNEHGHLVGVLSLRKLVVASPHSRVRDVMETDVISVTTETDQEEVAELAARYSFLAVPVVDDSNKLLGIVTVDDIIDVMREEATEDILKMAGVGTELTEREGVFTNIKLRFPWLLASCGGGLLGAAVMGTFTETLETHHFLAFFLPVILGMSGNVGTQAATVTVRSIAIGHIAEFQRGIKALRKEMFIGIGLGLAYGLIIGTVASFFGESPVYGLAIGLSLSAGMLVAATIGTSIPMLLSRMGTDPAIGTGPIVTTTVDMLGIFTYFTIAGFLFRLAEQI